MNLSRLNTPFTFKRPSLGRQSNGPLARRTARDLVGLDVEPGQAVAAEVRVNGTVQVVKAAGIPLPPDVVRDGEVSDVDSLAGALRELFGRGGFDKRVRLGLANQRIVVRRLELPPIDDPKELATAVRFRAQDEIPMPLDSVVLDFHSLGVVTTPDGPRQQIVLVAARRDMVERLLQAARDAGLRPEGVDLSAFAMIRALRPAGASHGQQTLYLAVGGLTNLAIADGHVCHFTRVLGGGLDQIVSDVAERSGVTQVEARGLLTKASAPASADDDPRALAQVALADGIRRIAAEVRNSLDFHRSQEDGRAVVEGVLCGPAIDVPGFQHLLATELGIPMRAAVVEQATADATDGVPPSRLTIAAGLAIEQGLA